MRNGDEMKASRRTISCHSVDGKKTYGTPTLGL